MFKLNKKYIIQTLNEVKSWKVGESNSFYYNGWKLTLKKEEDKYKPNNYIVKGYHENGSRISRRYNTVDRAFLHILNSFNENASIKNKYASLNDALNLLS